MNRIGVCLILGIASEEDWKLSVGRLLKGGSEEREPGHRKKQQNGLLWPRAQIRLRCNKSWKCFKAMKVEVTVVENALNIVDHRSDGGWTCLDSFLNFYVSHRPFFS